jgi:hypothetical protein
MNSSPPLLVQNFGSPWEEYFTDLTKHSLVDLTDAWLIEEYSGPSLIDLDEQVGSEKWFLDTVIEELNKLIGKGIVGLVPYTLVCKRFRELIHNYYGGTITYRRYASIRLDTKVTALRRSISTGPRRIKYCENRIEAARKKRKKEKVNLKRLKKALEDNRVKLSALLEAKNVIDQVIN